MSKKKKILMFKKIPKLVFHWHIIKTVVSDYGFKFFSKVKIVVTNYGFDGMIMNDWFKH